MTVNGFKYCKTLNFRVHLRESSKILKLNAHNFYTHKLKVCPLPITKISSV